MVSVALHHRDGKQVVNARLQWFLAALVLVLGAAVLTAAAALRSAEYDEQYTLFLTAGVARPAWPAVPFMAGDVRALQARRGSLAGIAHDLRATDVHPPLYFWTVALWRRLWGGGLFVARLWSVLCGLAALAATGVIARQVGVPPLLAMLLTLGCYGFAYTGAIARGFALAQALTLWGAVASLGGGRGRSLAAGLLLGAATFANYLAVFIASVMAAAVMCRRQQGAAHKAALTVLAMLPFLLGDAWFFAAQRDSRVGQFPPFRLAAAVARLARYAAANLFGGLPLYVPGAGRRFASAGLAGLAVACVALVVTTWPRLGRAAFDRRLLLAAVAAPPAGLLLLGAVFNNAPVELRYLAFATPFAALLLAGAVAGAPTQWRGVVIAVVLAVQAAGVAGMMLRPETMQPARATAAAVARLARGGVVLLPRGNDGVGVVGAMAIESPPALHLLVVDQHETPAEIAAGIGGAQRVVLALIAQDDASRATIPRLRSVVGGPCWQPAGQAFNAAAFERVRTSARRVCPAAEANPPQLDH